MKIFKILNSSIFSTTIGIIGITLAIIFYFSSKENRKPVYFIKQDSAIVFDKNNSSIKIKVVKNDSLVINQNVYMTTIRLWNDGNKEIKKEDIRNPFRIETSEKISILDYSIASEKNSGVNRFKLIKSNDNSLTISWDYFDPKDWVDIQIIYIGESKEEIFITGSVIGNKVSKIDKMEIFRIYHIPIHTLYVVLSLLCLAHYFYLNYYFQIKKPISNLKLKKTLTMASFFIVLTLYFIWINYMTSPPKI